MSTSIDPTGRIVLGLTGPLRLHRRPGLIRHGDLGGWVLEAPDASVRQGFDCWHWSAGGASGTALTLDEACDAANAARGVQS